VHGTGAGDGLDRGGALLGDGGRGLAEQQFGGFAGQGRQAGNR
jgi:hypothetical protein